MGAVLATGASVNNAYLWVYVLVGVVTLTGAIIAGVRWLKKQGVDEAAVKQLVDANVLNVLADLRDDVADIKTSTRANGLDTDLVGDVVKRVEIKLDEVKTALDRHIGAFRQAERAADRTHSDLWSAIERKQDKQHRGG